MIGVAIITCFFIVMLCLVGVLYAMRSSLRNENLFSLVSRICARISRYSVIIFALMLLALCNYGQLKELINAVLPVQSVKNIKFFITFAFGSSSVFSAIQSVLIYLLLVSCLTGLSAFFAIKLKAFLADNVKSFSDNPGTKNLAQREYKSIFLKPCLANDRYNS